MASISVSPQADSLADNVISARPLVLNASQRAASLSYRAVEADQMSMPLHIHQEEFLDSFLGRNDARTLLVAAPGSGKTVTSKVAAARMLARGLVDRVLFVAGHRVLIDQWRYSLQRHEIGHEMAAESLFAATTYAALARDPEKIWKDVPPGTRWLLLFDEVDWAGRRVEALAGKTLSRFPGSRALFVASEAPPIAVDTQFTFQFFGRDVLADPSLNPSRAVYCLNMTALKDEFAGDMLFREPRGYNNTRLVNQAGLFTLTPSGEDNLAAFIIDRLMDEEIISSEPVTRTLAGVDGSTEERVAEYEVSDNLAAQIKQYICKIHIPNIDRVGCLDMLRKMNIHNGSLFPDAQGASLYCNDWLERLLEEEKQEIREREERKFVPVSRVEVNADGDRIKQVKAILDQLIPEQNEEMRLHAAQKLDYRFENEASVDWQKSSAKTARVRTRLRQIMGLIEVPEDRRDQVLNELMSFYSSLGREANGVRE